MPRKARPRVDSKAKLVSVLIIVFIALAIINILIGFADYTHMQISVSTPVMPIFSGNFQYIYALDFFMAAVLIVLSAAFQKHLKTKYGAGCLSVFKIKSKR